MFPKLHVNLHQSKDLSPLSTEPTPNTRAISAEPDNHGCVGGDKGARNGVSREPLTGGSIRHFNKVMGGFSIKTIKGELNLVTIG